MTAHSFFLAIFAASVLAAPANPAEQGEPEKACATGFFDSFCSKEENSPDCYNPSSVCFCKGTNYQQSLVDEYICGDWRLGPAEIPTSVLEPILWGYDRFGGKCPGSFLKEYYQGNNVNWPPEDGFLLDGRPDGKGEPIMDTATLAVGTYIDRFGTPGGNFAAPAGALYTQRSILPSNLNPREQKCSADCPTMRCAQGGNQTDDAPYHVYKVLKEFDVEVGPVAPAFGQSGYGTQYRMLGQQVPWNKTEGQDEVRICDYLREGFLVEVDPAVIYEARKFPM